MAQILRHRGPDDEGFFESPSASLCSTRLAIVDVDRGHQPMGNEDGSVIVAFNGEIYNAEELRRSLQSSGHVFRTRCDTEVVPHLYEKYGDDFVQQLNGQFAIALWDARRRKLVLTRDRLGIKPLFYYPCGQSLRFGSEIKAILASLTATPNMNVEAFYHYLSFKFVPAPLTMYEGIAAVLPGEQVVFRDGKISKRTYWNLNETGDETLDAQDAVERLNHLLRASMQRRLVSDVPVGALLSGGVDSSLIVALASEFSGEPVKTFTLGYEGPFAHKDREAEAARQVAAIFDTEHHEHLTSHHEFVQDLPDILSAFDEPFAGVMSPYCLNKLVSQHVKVCLGGDGADELFGSYLAHRLAQPIERFLAHGPASVRKNPSLVAPFENDIDFVAGLADRRDWCWRANLLVFSDEEKRDLLNTDFTALGMCDTAAWVRGIFDGCLTKDVQNRQQFYDCRTVLPDLVLKFNDRLSMAHSVETRVPFLDHELVEFVAGLPGDWKIREGQCKWLLKEVARRYLPDTIVDRPKEGFVMPINDWQRDALRSRIEDTLLPERLEQHGLLRSDAVSQLVQRYYAGDTALQYKVWSLFCFQTWFEGRRPDDNMLRNETTKETPCPA